MPTPQRISIFAAAVLALLTGSQPASSAQHGTPSLAPVVREVGDAVVSISIHTAPLGFFGMTEAGSRGESGSGVVTDAKAGLVLTNHHVVADADHLEVQLNDDRTLPAVVLGSDPATDLALLQIETDGLFEIGSGDSGASEVGDYCTRDRQPLWNRSNRDFRDISAVNRSILRPCQLPWEGRECTSLVDFLQTDASINPGNSGGALVSLRGELIGINTMIIGPNRGSVGIGFAVPASVARHVARELLDHGIVRLGRLGVVLSDGRSNRFPNSSTRVRIERVERGSAAAKGGLRYGDWLVHLGDRNVRRIDGVRRILGLRPVGEHISLTIQRGYKSIKVRVMIEAEQRVAAGAPMPWSTPARGR